MASWQRLFCRILLVASIATVYSTRVQAAEDFYRSKTISIISSTGTYEMYARMFAKYMPKYIPGQPNIIVKVMTGASGLKATNYIANVAPRDGTEITAVQSHIPTTPLFSPQGTQYDPRTLSWIGSATKEREKN